MCAARPGAWALEHSTEWCGAVWRYTWLPVDTFYKCQNVLGGIADMELKRSRSVDDELRGSVKVGRGRRGGFGFSQS